MPRTAKQKQVACIAVGMKDGKVKKRPGSPATQMAETMSREKLLDWCHGPIEKK